MAVVILQSAWRIDLMTASERFTFVRAIRMCFLLCVVIFLQSGCTGVSDGARARLVIVSSTSYLSLAEALARDFQLTTGNPVEVKGTLGQEERMLRTKLADVVITSGDDLRLPNLTVSNIAFDQTVVIVNEANSLRAIDTEQLREIYSGSRTSWWASPRGKIQVMAREPSSSIRNSFEQEYLKPPDGGKMQVALTALVVNSNPEMRSAVAAVPGSIGYISTGSLGAGVRKLNIIEKANGTEVMAPLMRIFASSEASNNAPVLKQFFDYLSGPNAERVVIAQGLKTATTKSMVQ